MTRAILAATLPLLLLPAGARATEQAIPRRAAAPAPRLAGAAPSVEMLLARFVKALTAKDRAALARLRVSEAEYRTIILPGNVEPGTPLRKLPEKESDFAWGLLNTKSLYSELALLDQFGGRTYTVNGFEFTRGTKQWAGFTTHQKVHLRMEDAEGRPCELTTGSIVELAGQYKFVSFIRD